MRLELKRLVDTASPEEGLGDAVIISIMRAKMASRSWLFVVYLAGSILVLLYINIIAFMGCPTPTTIYFTIVNRDYQSPHYIIIQLTSKY